MEYQFVRTSTGPVVMGEGEVLYFSDYAQLFDYMDEDPEFANKAVKFCEETVKEYAQMLIDSFDKPVLGHDLPKQISMYYAAIHAVRDFQGRYNSTLAQYGRGPQL